MTNGIYTLANDFVYDQLVALLNSIEANAGKEIPVCVIAYDNQVEKVKAEVEARKNVALLNDSALFTRWEDFSFEVWKTHPTALQTWRDRGISTRFYRIGENHRYCAFDQDSPFEKFIYLDADTLVMDSLDPVFEKLDESDVVVYDFQYKDPSHIYNLQSEKLYQVFSSERINQEIFCSGFYASKRGLLDQERKDWLISQLQNGDSDILYPSAPNQSVLNYMVMKSGMSVYNFVHQLPTAEVTGNSVASSHFELKNNVLYDKAQRLTYLHYIGLSSKLFSRLCAGENIDFPYRDVFLHYRYLHEPDKQPQFRDKPKPYNAPPSLKKRVMKKLGLAR
uniref:Npun_R2821/Npun_R2822 family protein n=1 Tax=Trichocoleus desertorum TaxID=1481672 RepID=UPI0025B5A0FC|nr:Npun_R2821/Npun_R2822 family protein [Trichocoleus desertorum]